MKKAQRCMNYAFHRHHLAYLAADHKKNCNISARLVQDFERKYEKSEKGINYD